MCQGKSLQFKVREGLSHKVIFESLSYNKKGILRRGNRRCKLYEVGKSSELSRAQG